MTVEDRLRDALLARADTVTPVEGQWSRISDRIGPPARRRWRGPVVAGGCVAAAAVVVAAVVLLAGGGSDRPRRLATAGPSSTAAPAVGSSLPAPTPTPDARAGPRGGPVPAGFRPVSVTWISARQGWVLGTAPCPALPCTSLLRTTDGGATWAGVPAPADELSEGVPTGVSRVRFADPSNGWIFGPDLWATHDGGATWHRDISLGDFVSSLEAGGGYVYAVVGTGGTARVFAGPVDPDGLRQVGSDDVAAGAVIALHGSSGYVMGADGAVRALSPTTVERRGTPCGLGRVGDLAVAGADVVTVCASDPGAGSSTKTVMVSHDGARTWSVAGTAPRGGQPRGVAAASTSTLVLAADGGASYLYRSDDGGATWTTAYADTTSGGEGFVDLGFTDASRGVAVEGRATIGSRLLVTTDAGRTWSPVSFGP